MIEAVEITAAAVIAEAIGFTSSRKLKQPQRNSLMITATTHTNSPERSTLVLTHPSCAIVISVPMSIAETYDFFALLFQVLPENVSAISAALRRIVEEEDTQETKL